MSAFRLLTPCLGLLLLCGCPKKDASDQVRILGTWEVRQHTAEGGFLDMRTNYMVDSKMSATGTATTPAGEVVPVVMSGTWSVKDGYLHMTIQSSNIPQVLPIGFTHVEKLISVSDRELRTQGSDGIISVGTRIR